MTFVSGVTDPFILLVNLTESAEDRSAQFYKLSFHFFPARARRKAVFVANRN